MVSLPRLVPGIIARNARLKLAALGLAVFLWALLRTTEPTTGVNVFTVPVRAQIADLAWALEGDPQPAAVQVRLRGPTEELIRIARDGTTLRVPVDSVWSADTLVELRRDWVVLGGATGLVVEDVAPPAVRLTLQPMLSAVLPLEVVTSGELDEGVALAAPLTPDPQNIRVRGPAHRIRVLESVRLRPLDLRDVTESGAYAVAVDTTGLGDLSVTPLNTTVGVRVEPEVTRLLADVPVVVEGDIDGSYEVMPSVIEVQLAGARTPVNGTRPEEVRAVVALEPVAGLEPGQTEVGSITFQGVPPLVRVLSVDADSILVRRTAP